MHDISEIRHIDLSHKIVGLLDWLEMHWIIRSWWTFLHSRYMIREMNAVDFRTLKSEGITNDVILGEAKSKISKETSIGVVWSTKMCS